MTKRLMIFFILLTSAFSYQKAYTATSLCSAAFLCLDSMGREMVVNCQPVFCDRRFGIRLPDGSLSGVCNLGPRLPVADCCLTDGECNDMSECTKDRCDLTTNRCVHTLDGMPTSPPGECKHWDCEASRGWISNPDTDGTTCTEDGNLCTLDRCTGGICRHPARPEPTSPAMTCNRWSCLPSTGIWSAVSDDSLLCDDGDMCTRNACRSGTCRDITTPADAALLCPRPACTPMDAAVTCNDGDPCTVDACSPGGMCSHVPGGTDDGNLCTTDTCSVARGIEHVPVTFNDDNVCTLDTCDAATGHPVFTPREIEDDGNPCTKDICDRTLGMLHNLDSDRGYECFEGATCDLTTCRRRILPSCTLDCRQPFFEVMGIHRAPQGDTGIQCHYDLTTRGIDGIVCREMESPTIARTAVSGMIPVNTTTLGRRSVVLKCSTPAGDLFSCEDNIDIFAQGTGGSGGSGGAGNAGTSGSGGAGGTTTPIEDQIGAANYDVYVCLSHERTATNLRGQRITLASECPELPIGEAVEDLQRQIAQTLVDLDVASDNFTSNVRPLVALAVQKWMTNEADRTMYSLQFATPLAMREINATEKAIVRTNFNRNFRVTSLGIEKQSTVSASSPPLFSETVPQQAILLNYDLVYAQGRGCSLIQ